MKKSEFEDGVADVCGGASSAKERAMAVALAEAAGVKWDPEEPELPKRLIREREFVWNAVDGEGNESFGIIDLSALITAGLDNLTYRVLHAAFDAYNKLQAGELVPLPVATEEILKLIREKDAITAERDQIRTSLESILGVDMDERGGSDNLDQLAAHFLAETVRKIGAEIGVSGSAGYIAKAVIAKLRADRGKFDAATHPDIISKTSGGKTVHYAIGPVRETREEAEKDLREWFDKAASEDGTWKKVPFPSQPGKFMALPPGIRIGSLACDAFLREIEYGIEGWRRVKEAMEYLDSSDTVYRILNGEEP